MSSLPTELDFATDPAATPARMNRAMEYVIARLRAVEAVQPEFLTALDELRAVGLTRVTEVLAPIFDQANDIADALEAIKATWEADTTPAQVVADAVEAVTEAFEDYRHRYWGAYAVAPTVGPEGQALVIGVLYFDTALDAMRVYGASGWKNAGSTVAGIMEQFDPIVATGGQTVFPISGGYDVGYLIVIVNGAVIPPADYTATNGTSVTLGTALSAGDEVTGVKFGAITLSTVYTKTQVDAAFRTIADSYTKAQVDTAIAAKANTADVYSKAAADGRYSQKAANLTDLTDAAAARTALGVGAAGTRADSFFVRASGTGKLSVGTVAPSSPAAGDLWVDTN